MKFTERKPNRNKNFHICYKDQKLQNLKISQTEVFLSPQFRFCLEEDAEISWKPRKFGFD